VRGSALLFFLLPATALAAFPFFSTFTIPKLVVAGLVLGPLLLLDRTEIKRPDLPLALYLLYLLCSVPAWVKSPFVHETTIQVVLDLLALAVYLLARRGLNGRDAPGRAGAWLAASGLLVFLFFALERLFGMEQFVVGALKGSSTLGNPDFVAEFAAFCLPAGFLLLFGGGRIRPAAGLATLSAMGYVLEVLNSLTALLAAVVALAVGAVALAVPRFGPRRTFVAAAGATLAAIAVIAAAGLPISKAGQGRLYLYRLSLAAARAGPVAGHGTGAFPSVFMEEQGKHQAATRAERGFWTNARHAHNELLNMWVERGLVPVLLFLAFLALHVVRLVARGPPGNAFLLSSLTAAFCLFLGSVTFNLVPVRIGFFLLLGLAARTQVRSAKCEARSGKAGAAAWAPRAVLAAVIVLAPLWLATADFLFVKGDYAASAVVNPFNGRTLLFRGLGELERGELDAACPRLEQSARRYPNLSTLLALGNCRVHTGDYGAAEAWYRKALQWKPTYSLAYANLAALYHLQGDREAAWRHIARAASLNPGNPRIEAIRKRVCRGNDFCLAPGPVPGYSRDLKSGMNDDTP